MNNRMKLQSKPKLSYAEYCSRITKKKSSPRISKQCWCEV